jgi:L-lactate dehydrogenase complex protein LldG
MAMSEMANPSRERILARIGRALRQKTSFPACDATPLFSPVANLLQRFQDECKANITECTVTHDRAETCARLRALLAEIPAGEIFVEDTPDLRTILQNMDRLMNWSSDGPPSEQCRATVTQCHALVALTGSVLTSSGCGGRGASIVAPVHVVVAHESQLVADLEPALQLIRLKKLSTTSSFVGLITGCSRTGDIEKQLVIGAHGPQRLVVIVEKDRKEKGTDPSPVFSISKLTALD